MRLFFVFTAPSGKEQRFEIKPNLTIGRKNADLLLEDGKVSGRHAIVEKRMDRGFFLVDLGSANGLKVDGGLKVKEVELKPGVTVRVGRVALRVIDAEIESVVVVKPLSEDVPEEEQRTRIQTKLEGWQNILTALVEATREALTSAKLAPAQIVPMKPLVELKIVRGKQYGEIWLVGYGPRKVGGKTLDLRLEEPNIPDVCFEIFPSPEGPKFQTAHPDRVLLNGKSVSADKLGDGDIIEIQQTRISVGLSTDDGRN